MQKLDVVLAVMASTGLDFKSACERCETAVAAMENDPHFDKSMKEIDERQGALPLTPDADVKP